MSTITNTAGQLLEAEILEPAIGAGRGLLLRRVALSMRRWADRRRLRDIDPHLARDIGVAPGWNRAPEGFVVDPRPLWGIGLTPEPVGELPRPWNRKP
jgi:hypothetical protein